MVSGLYVQEKRRKAINSVRRQWEAAVAANGRRRVGRGSATTVMSDLQATHVANFPNIDTPRRPRDSSPDR